MARFEFIKFRIGAVLLVFGSFTWNLYCYIGVARGLSITLVVLVLCDLMVPIKWILAGTDFRD